MTRRRKILAGDIGGTKTYLGLFESGANGARPLGIERFDNARFRSVKDVIACFLDANGARCAVDAAVIGVACPIENNRGRLTNTSWTIDGRAIEKAFNIKNVRLINDLVALGYGAGVLANKDLIVIRKGIKKPANAALIAAGTGLGEAILFRTDGGAFMPSASEGGHADFAPQDPVEAELLGYLSKKYGHVSYERVVSGMGLEEIHSFFKARSGLKLTERLRQRFAREGDRAAVIFDEAVKGTDRDCQKAFRLFMSVYGAEAGNLALKSLALGGVYLGGGIAPKVFKNKEARAIFLRSFSAKGRFKRLLDSVPVYIIKDDRAALWGAASYAEKLCDNGME